MVNSLLVSGRANFTGVLYRWSTSPALSCRKHCNISSNSFWPKPRRCAAFYPKRGCCVFCLRFGGLKKRYKHKCTSIRYIRIHIHVCINSMHAKHKSITVVITCRCITSCSWKNNIYIHVCIHIMPTWYWSYLNILGVIFNLRGQHSYNKAIWVSKIYAWIIFNIHNTHRKIYQWICGEDKVEIWPGEKNKNSPDQDNLGEHLVWSCYTLIATECLPISTPRANSWYFRTSWWFHHIWQTWYIINM